MVLHQQLHQRLSMHMDALLEQHGTSYNYLHSYVMEGGKQRRPMIFLEALLAWGCPLTPAILDVACGLELMHAYLLIHDDIMDGDELRRDKPTLHAHFLQSGMQDGLGRALVWGDLLFAKALQLVVTYPDPAIAHPLAVLMTDITLRTVEGQLLEADRSRMPDLESLLTFYERKTALYTLQLPLQAAVIVSGKKVSQDTLASFATNAGIAYQLYDDYIEVIGEKARLEGGRCGDLMRLKATPLLLRVLRELPVPLQEIVRRKFASGEALTLEEEEEIRATMKLGSLMDILSLCRHHATIASELLEELGLGGTPTLPQFLAQYVSVAASHTTSP